MTPDTAFTERSFSIGKSTMRKERSSCKETTTSQLCFIKVNSSSVKKRSRDAFEAVEEEVENNLEQVVENDSDLPLEDIYSDQE